jgi:hypothetical protein
MSLLEDRCGPWKPISKATGIAWLVVFALFLLYALADHSGFLFIDWANLMIHEAGHPLFSWFGSYTLTILGGTLAEMIVPLLCAITFFFRREVPGTAFALFWFFENFLYIGTYMSDARAEVLPLVGNGDHDWNILFSQWHLLLQDSKIGGTTRLLGWLGMLAICGWLAWQTFRPAPSQTSHH